MSTEYHKIETLYERDPKTFKVYPGQLKNSVYGLIKEWEWTEKIDGTNIRVMWEPQRPACSSDPYPDSSAANLTFGGKSDNAQINAELVNWLNENIKAEKLVEIFPDTSAVIYGEGYGAGIQKGGAYSPTKKFIVFDVLVGGKWWLSRENVLDVATKLGLEVVPFVGVMTLEQATEMVRQVFPSVLGTHPPAEGLVGRPAEALFDKKGHRLIVKLKTKDF